MHCLEGLLSGGTQRTELECIYIHLHRRLLERSEFRVVWNQDADSIQTSVEIDAHAVLIKLIRLCCTFPPKEGAVNNADYRGGVTCLYDTQLLGACLHASESGGRSRPQAVRGMPEVPIAPPATGPQYCSARVLL